MNLWMMIFVIRFCDKPVSHIYINSKCVCNHVAWTNEIIFVSERELLFSVYCYIFVRLDVRLIFTHKFSRECRDGYFSCFLFNLTHLIISIPSIYYRHIFVEVESRTETNTYFRLSVSNEENQQFWRRRIIQRWLKYIYL